MMIELVGLKLGLLCQGINFTKEFVEYYQGQTSSIEKRHAYGVGDNVIVSTGLRAPQEIILGERIIVAANYSPASGYLLDLEGGRPVLKYANTIVPVAFPFRPISYGKRLSNGERFEQHITVYGDSTLGVFSPGHCYYFNDGRECKFCSLGAARENLTDHKMRIRGNVAGEAVGMAIRDEGGRYKRVLLNGGTIPNYDKGYKIHLDLLERIKDANLHGGLEYHLISMPPKNFNLFERFKGVGNKMSMSLEVFDSKRFSEVCPGKAEDYTRERFFSAFEAAVEIIGRGNVYAGFVAGMEPLDSLIDGIEYFGNMGVVPAVAVFHPDAGSQYSGKQRPSVDFLMKLGKKMSEIYRKEGFCPLIEGSGRNSLDTEAYLGGFV